MRGWRAARTLTLTLAVGASSTLVGLGGPAQAAVAQVRADADYRLTPTVNMANGRGKNGPGLAANPSNANHVIATHQDLQTQECEVNRSVDGGLTWSSLALDAPAGFPATPCTRLVGTPSIAQQAVAFGSGNTVYVAWRASNNAGATYSALLSTSTDGGLTFGQGRVIAPGGGVGGLSYGAPELVVDQRTASTTDDRLFISARETRDSRVVVIRSDNSASTFLSAVQATSTVAPTPVWNAEGTAVTTKGNAYGGASQLTQPVLGPVPPEGGNRPLYVGWVAPKSAGACPPACESSGETAAHGYLVVATSKDLGATWRQDRAVNVRGLIAPNGTPSAPDSTPRLAAGLGEDLYMVFNQGPGLGGSNSCGVGPYPGAQGTPGTYTCSAYGSFSGEESAPSFERDVWFIRSINRGASWGDLVQVNDTEPTDLAEGFISQTFGPQVYLAADGRVDVVWNDRRHAFYGTSDRKGATAQPVSASVDYACVKVGNNCPEARLSDTYYARSRNRGGTFTADRRIADRSHNNDVGYDYKWGPFGVRGPAVAHLATGELLVADIDSRLGRPGNDSQDIFLRRVRLSAPSGLIPVAVGGAGGSPELSVALSQLTRPGGGESVLGVGNTSRPWTRPVIVNEADFPAALVGGVLARANLGPVLTSPQAGLPAATKAEITRLAPVGAYILGDVTKLSAQVEAELAAAGVPAGQIVRISSGTPGDLAAAVATNLDRRRQSDKETTPPLPAFDAVIIANPNSASAGAASALAASRRLPVLFTDMNAIPAVTTATISSLGITRKIIVGSTGVISATVAAALGTGVTRVGDGDQFDASADVVKESLTRGLPANIVYVADGSEPMHAALLGSTVGRMGGQLLLVPGGNSNNAESTVSALGLCGVVDRLVTSNLTGTAVVANDPGSGAGWPNTGGPCPAAPAEAAPENLPAAPPAPTATGGSGSATVSWTAPSNGGSQLKSYVVTPYKAGVAQAAVKVGLVLSTTIGGLTNGVPYTFTVRAVNGVGTGPASPLSSPVTPQVPTKVVITSAPALATYAIAAKVVGKLTRADNGGAVPGRGVQLQYRKRGTAGAFIASTTVNTTSTGVVTFAAFKPPYSVDIRLVRLPSSTSPWGASTSATRAMPVQRRITATLSRTSMALGGTATLSGSVAPNASGRTIYLQRFNGSWGGVTSRTLSSSSGYSFAIKPTARGTYYYRVRLSADSSFAASNSATVRLSVT